MKKHGKLHVLLVLILAVLCFAGVAIAQKYPNGKTMNMYCDDCGKTMSGILTYAGDVIYYYKACERTAGCRIMRVYEKYDWNCETCGYGSGAHGIDVEVRRYHSSSACPEDDVVVNAAPIIRLTR